MISTHNFRRDPRRNYCHNYRRNYRRNYRHNVIQSPIGNAHTISSRITTANL